MKRSSLRTRTPPARATDRFDEQTLLTAETHIQCREHDAASLARAMGVSTATVARIIAALRRNLERTGGEIVSVKRRGRSHYEIRDDEARARRWKAFGKLVGLARGAPLKSGETIDDVIYGNPHS